MAQGSSDKVAPALAWLTAMGTTLSPDTCLQMVSTGYSDDVEASTEAGRV